MEFKNIDWKITSFIVLYQVLLILALPFYFYYSTPSFGILLAAAILVILTGISITAGYHRLYSHRSYKAAPLFEIIILFFATMAFQGSALRWSHTHRLHHRFVDKEKDPHNINRGILYAHILWIFRKPEPLDNSIIPDLASRKLLQFQDKHYKWLAFGANFIAFAVVGIALHDPLGAFILVWWARLFLVHHFTWFINSLAHTWGAKTYSREQTAVNNAIIALLTFGEGYHNYHHVFASDYRNGIRWYQYDPTKWLIWSLSKIGLAADLTAVDKYVSKNKIIMEDKHIFLDALKRSTYEKKQTLEKNVVELADRISGMIAETKRSISNYSKLKRAKSEKHALRPLRQRIKELELKIKKDWDSWRNLEKEVSKHAVLGYHHA